MNNDFENNNLSKDSQFGLPENYFQKSAASVFLKVEWLEEHKHFPKLLAVKNKEVFEVPSNYFTSSEQQLELINYPVLKGISKQNGFGTPDHYFEETKAIVLATTIGEEESVLRGFVKQNSFIVKPDYFSKNEKRLKDVIQPKTKVVSLFRVRTLAAAAAVIGCILGSWIYMTYFVSTQEEDCGTIACIERRALLNSNSLESLDDEALYELIDPKALQQKLENSTKDIKENNNSDHSNDSASDYLLDAI